MSNVDTLLDLGDASAPPQDTNQTNPPNLLDPFDQLAPSTESLSPQKTPEQTDLLGSFDPFSSTTMSSATNGDAAIDASLSTDQVKTMEQEFDDLLGGFSSTTPTETVTNGTTDEPVVHLDEDLGESSTTDDIVTVTQKTTSVDGETVITETRTETLSDGRTLIETSSVTEKETESAIDSNGLENGEQAEAEKKMSTSSDKEKQQDDPLKGVDIMKARYEGREETPRTKYTKKPKKLDQTIYRQGEREGPQDGTPKVEIKEGTAELKLLSGLDYSKSKYERLAEKEKELAELSKPPSKWNDRGKKRPPPPPVNKVEVVKVAPPEITQNLCAMFESGEIPDRHKVKKMDIDTKDAPGSGVYENEPEKRSNVVRSSDKAEKAEFEQGHLQKMKGMWAQKQEEAKEVKVKRGPIKLADDESGPTILESTPVVRDDVVRSEDATEDALQSIKAGRAKELRDQITKAQSDKPKVPRKPIKLTSDETGPAVLESTPVFREDVVRSDEATDDVLASIQSGRAKAMKESFLKAQDDSTKTSKKPISLTEGDTGPTVLESTPVYKEGVVRSEDYEDDVLTSIEAGKAKSLREKFISSQEEKPKERKKINLYESTEERSVFENEPIRKKDVVRADEEEPEVQFERGSAKQKAGFFTQAANQERDYMSKKPIEIKREGEEAIVLESEPQILEGVVRSGVDDHEVSIEKGKTKNLKGFWQSVQEDDNNGKEKEPIKLDTDNGPAVVENEPEEIDPDVIKSGEQSTDVLYHKRGQARSTAARFLKSGENEPKERKMPIKLDVADGPAVIENEPEAGRDDVVRSSYEGHQVDLERGHLGRLVNRFAEAEAEAATTKTSSSAPLPAWKLELERAKQEAEQAANREEEADEERREVVREDGVMDEQLELLKTRQTKNLRTMWQSLEETRDEDEKAAPKQLVCFTPPREMSPEREEIYKEVGQTRTEPEEPPLPDYVPPPEIPVTTSATLVFDQS